MGTADVDELVAPDVKEQLIDLYFEWEQPWHHFVDERLFRDSLLSYGCYSSPLLLLCVLAVGSRYSDRLEVRSDPNDPNTAGRIFLEPAETLLRSDIKSPSITTIQSLGILGIYYVVGAYISFFQFLHLANFFLKSIGSDNLGWLHFGMANRLLIDLGFNLDSTVLTGIGSLEKEEVQLRRQVYWSLYCNDKLWASYTGRVCTMLDSQGAVPLPTTPLSNEMDSGGASALSRSLSHLLRALATHCQILERILMNLYAPKRLALAAEKRGFFESCMFTLKGWYYSLPKELKINTAMRTHDGSPSPHAYIINMVYHTSIILLAKPFLSYGERNAPKFAVPQPGENDDFPQRASAVCLEAAGEICRLAEGYREAFHSFRRSPLTATHCTLTAALVILFVRHENVHSTALQTFTDFGCCMKTV
ncbi:hypothetical protein CDEST_10543 [Colletotrichum destructivum]|uniref:Xylanolytic transcriptional activator regulatory domain-containing protein n=1 Tax=Colletotrichum destructivum TaxID=34406 RepID=A0AAX4IQ02_9PEZI|nr:hypothetical protein CDEST_10543 [Colletotrichum destructivum]